MIWRRLVALLSIAAIVSLATLPAHVIAYGDPTIASKSWRWNSSVPNYNVGAKIFEGTVDTTNLQPADFVGTGWKAPPDEKTHLYGDRKDCKGMDDSYESTCPYTGDGNTNGDILDGKYVVLGIKGSGLGVGDYPGWWDLGAHPSTKIAYFQSQDHGPYPEEGMDCRIYGSNTLGGGPVSKLWRCTEIYKDGWLPHDSTKDLDGNGWLSDDIAVVFECPTPSQPYRYICVAPWIVGGEGTDFGDPEVDAICYWPTVATPVVELEKRVNGQDADSAPGPTVTVGSEVTFEFVVKNTGSVVLTNVRVTDNVLGPIDTIPSLAIGASVTLTKKAPAVLGQHQNTGSVITNEGAIASDPGNYDCKAAVEPACVGDFVWEDSNGNGIQDDGNTGLEGVVVKLFDCSGQIIDTATTDADGKYLFSGVAPGDYKIFVEPPEDYVFSPKGDGSRPDQDSDADPDGKIDCFTLVSGQSDLTRDVGLCLSQSEERASVGDFVWSERVRDGIHQSDEPGLAGVVVNLLDCSDQLVATTTTNDEGLYGFTGVTPGDYKLQFVAPPNHVFSAKWQGGDPTTDSDANYDGFTDCFTLVAGQNDMTRDAGLWNRASFDPLVWEDLNGNGVYDQDEVGLPNVTVELYSSDGHVVDSTATDADGFYAFYNLTPGLYYLRFLAPTGYLFTPKGSGSDDTRDSDARQDGTTDCFTLVSGENDLIRNAGLYKRASIGDLVWEDVNRDGIQDEDERGLGDVKVELHTSDGWWLETTSTDASGFYIFSDLTPGSYYLKFVAPAGYRYSSASQDGDIAIDSSTGETECFALASGKRGLMWDAGLYREGKPTSCSFPALAIWGLAGLAVVLLAGSALLVLRSKVLTGDK